MSETVFERGPLVSLENSVGFLTTVLIILLNLLTELNNFTSLNVFFKGGQRPPPPGRFNPPIASMAVCEVSEVHANVL